MIEFELETELITLNQLLKAMGIAETGGRAFEIIDEGIVSVNGDIEMRRRKKLYKGDIIEIDDEKIKIV
ncbi:MAG: RNA-binding S4 domain-containing protein [Bacteroidota bacterium]|nr:RNA-binding S4 domain-containing protein [Bacteroidota bacterium]